MNALSVFPQGNLSGNGIEELHIIDSTLTKTRLDLNAYISFFENSCDSYADIRDSLKVFCNPQTGTPFTGRLILYRDTGQLVIEHNFLDGRKYGWQIAYNDDGTEYEKRRYEKRLPNMSWWMDECYEMYQYHANGQLKKSFVFDNDSLLLYKETNYYPNGQISSSGHAKYTKQIIRYHSGSMLGRAPTKRQKRHISRRRKKGIGYFYVQTIRLNKTGYWKFYNEDGSPASEGEYEIGHNIYGEVCEQQVGEWIDYNKQKTDADKLRPLDLSAVICEFPLRIDQVDLGSKNSGIRLSEGISSMIEHVIKDYATDNLPHYTTRTYKDTYINTILLYDSLQIICLILLKRYPAESVDGRALFYDRQKKLFMNEVFVFNLQALYDFDKGKFASSNLKEYLKIVIPEIEITDYDEDGINDYKFTSLILNNGIYNVRTTIITIRNEKIDILMKEEKPFLKYEPKSF